VDEHPVRPVEHDNPLGEELLQLRSDVTHIVESRPSFPTPA
jgi:hypothetical protein